jgi:hypothetical protein
MCQLRLFMRIAHAAVLSRSTRARYWQHGQRADDDSDVLYRGVFDQGLFAFTQPSEHDSAHSGGFAFLPSCTARVFKACKSVLLDVAISVGSPVQGPLQTTLSISYCILWCNKSMAVSLLTKTNLPTAVFSRWRGEASNVAGRSGHVCRVAGRHGRWMCMSQVWTHG